MPGVFSKSARPKRPGAYFNWEAGEQEIILPNTGSIVALPFTHDWGPFKAATLCQSFAEFQAIFGSSSDTPGYMAVKQAFVGEGLEGRGGAGAVLAYRTGGASAAKAALTLQNATPSNAITLTARYEGTRGNALRVTTQDHATDATKNELILLDGTTPVETYVYTDTDLASLAAQINANSGWVSAEVLQDGVALAPVSAQALTGGDNGLTLAAGDWTALMSAIEIERFGLFVPYDLLDSGVLASLKTWADNLNDQGKRFRTVVGGAAGELITDATARSASLNDSDFVNVGVGTLTDDEFGDISTAQFAPRLAGVLAAKGETKSATFARFTGLSIKAGATQAEILTAFDGGVVVLSRDSHPTAPTRVEKALTTYTGGDETKPYLIYRNPKFIATMQGLETELTEWAEQTVIGQLPITDKTRELVVGEAKVRLDARVANGAVQEGYTVRIDQDPPPTDEDEFIGLAIGLKFGRSLEQLFYTVKVG